MFAQRQADIQARDEQAFRDRMIAGHAVRIVAAEYERVAHLYDLPTVPPSDLAVQVAARVNVLFRP